MKVINFAEQRSLVNQFMMELRDENIQKDMLRFRNNIMRIGEIMAYRFPRHWITMKWTRKLASAQQKAMLLQIRWCWQLSYAQVCLYIKA